MKHIHDLFGDVKDFFDSEELPLSKEKIQDILSDDPANRKLQMELAITIDAGESFVKSTYVLEGDGALAFRAFEEVSKLRAVISTVYYPNVIAVAKKLSGGIPTREKQLIDYAKSCVEPGYQYFEDKFGNDLKSALSAFECLRYFNPAKINELQPSAGDLDDLQVLPFFSSAI